VNSVVSDYNIRLFNATFSEHAVKAPPPVDARLRVWFNPDLESQLFIIPGLIAVIIMIIASLLTSLTVAKEWERGTMEQLIATPVRAHEVIFGKFFPYFVIGYVDLLIATVMGKYIFGVPLNGSLILLIALSSLFLTGALMMGILFSVIAKNQRLASQIAMLTTFIPTFLLSGYMYPVSNMPRVIQWITYTVPARYFITILRGIFLKGVGITVLWKQAVFLLIFSAVMVFLATKKFKKKIV
jgi:ABC-2 type transport system permease protein